MSTSAAPGSFHSFYRQHVHGVIALGLSMTGDRGVAEDIAQEAFTRAYRDWDRVGTYDNPGAWVRRVASNLAISRWRRMKSEARALMRLGNRPEAPHELQPRDEEFWAAVRGLPDRQALALALHYVEDLPVAEIAEILECAEGTAKSLLHRGRKALADQLGLDTTEVAR